MTATTITTAELATALDTTPRELRKFLRSDASKIEAVGKGKRYALPSTKRDIAALNKRFTAWAMEKAEKVTAPESDNEVIEVDGDNDDEPTDD